MKRVVLVMITALFCGALFTSCVADNNFDLDVKNVQSAEVLFEKLEAAYQLSSANDLEEFFKEWNSSVSSDAVNNIKRDKVVEEIYEIYKTFYNPLDLTKLGDWEWGNSLNSNSKYVVIQNNIKYAVLEEELLEKYYYSGIYESINYITIDDFRPPLSLPKNKVLYLVPEYKNSLNMFLGTESTEIGENGIMTPSIPKGDSDKRYSFIRPYIPVLHGHWGGYWHIATHPEISEIFIDTKHVVAKVFFRVGFQGGEATMKKKSHKWVIENSQATWIE